MPLCPGSASLNTRPQLPWNPVCVMLAVRPHSPAFRSCTLGSLRCTMKTPELLCWLLHSTGTAGLLYRALHGSCLSCPEKMRQAYPAVLRWSMSKLDGSGSRLTTVASGHNSLNRSVDMPQLAPVVESEMASGFIRTACTAAGA